MSAAMITTKGQVTIPKNVRDTLHVQMGDRIEFIQISEERYEIIAVTKNVEQLKGIVKSKNTKAVSIDEMNNAIALIGSS